MATCSYVGEELDLFAKAAHWKAYLRDTVSPYITGDVLEVGAGLGATTLALCTKSHTGWTCLEPDRTLAERLRETLAQAGLPLSPEILTRQLVDLQDGQLFNTILYVDVLEHIADDAGELEAARRVLRPDGHLVVIGPAHQWLFSEFDRAIGHYRRYSRMSLAAAVPRGMRRVLLRYLDCAGVLLSAGNRWLLRSSSPSQGQVLFWDRFLVHVSRMLDPLFAWRLGKTVIGVWRPDSSV